MILTKSWNHEETLYELAEKHRNQEIVKGVVRSLDTMKIPVVNEKGEISMFEGETLIVALPGGVTGYCPSSEFRNREFKTLRGFVGTTQHFIVTRIDLEHQLALLSEKQAAAKLRDEFWSEIKQLEQNGELEDTIFDAVVSGVNQKNGTIHLYIQGQDCFMHRRDWDWSERPVVDAQRGETIKVKIVRYDETNGIVQVSRKKTLVDPKEILSELKHDQIIAAKVSAVSKLHGIFVTVEEGVELKAGKVRRLEEPDVGDIVTCRVQRVNPEERKGKVIIIDYPRGKRKKKDLGSFLFDE